MRKEKNKRKNNYKSLNHSKFLIRYHIIFACKYRKKLLISLGDDIKQIMYNISNKYDFVIEEIEVDKDHVHFMISSVPKLSSLQMVRVLKQQSAKEIWKLHKTIFLNTFGKKRLFGWIVIFAQVLAKYHLKH